MWPTTISRLPSGWLFYRAPVQVAAGDGDPRGDLRLDRAEAGLLGELRLDAVAGQGLELGFRIGRVAVAAHALQVLVVSVRASEDTGPQEGMSMAQLLEKHIRRAWSVLESSWLNQGTESGLPL